jgi:hypothetical protein
MGRNEGTVRGNGRNAKSDAAAGRKREGYVKAMQPLLKKNVTRYVGNDKHIRIGFNRKGIEHIANDILTKKVRMSKKETSNLDNLLREAEYTKSSGLYKPRTDGINRFYYFEDKKKNLRYKVAEEPHKLKNGKIIINRYLYAIARNTK